MSDEAMSDEELLVHYMASDEAVRGYAGSLLGDEVQMHAIVAFSDGAEWGAGWAFAIVGMAQAIRDNPRYEARGLAPRSHLGTLTARR